MVCRTFRRAYRDVEQANLSALQTTESVREHTKCQMTPPSDVLPWRNSLPLARTCAHEEKERHSMSATLRSLSC